MITKVLYNAKQNKFIVMPGYLVAVDDNVVHILISGTCFWKERPELVLLGDL